MKGDPRKTWWMRRAPGAWPRGSTWGGGSTFSFRVCFGLSVALSVAVLILRQGQPVFFSWTLAAFAAGLSADTIRAAGAGGETVWRDTLAPDEQEVLKRYFK